MRGLFIPFFNATIVPARNITRTSRKVDVESRHFACRGYVDVLRGRIRRVSLRASRRTFYCESAKVNMDRGLFASATRSRRGPVNPVEIAAIRRDSQPWEVNRVGWWHPVHLFT